MCATSARVPCWLAPQGLHQWQSLRPCLLPGCQYSGLAHWHPLCKLPLPVAKGMLSHRSMPAKRRECSLSTVGLTDKEHGCCRLCAPCVKRSSWALRNRATTKVCSAVTWRSRSGKATCTVQVKGVCTHCLVAVRHKQQPETDLPLAAQGSRLLMLHYLQLWQAPAPHCMTPEVCSRSALQKAKAEHVICAHLAVQSCLIPSTSAGWLSELLHEKLSRWSLIAEISSSPSPRTRNCLHGDNNSLGYLPSRISSASRHPEQCLASPSPTSG